MKEIYKVANLAVALFVFNWLEPIFTRLTASWGEPWGRLTSNGLALIASAALVLALTGGTFARPKLRIVWRHDKQEVLGPCEQLVADGQGPIKAYDVQLSGEGRSLLARALSRYCAKAGGMVTVSLDPDDAVIFVEEVPTTHATATVAPNSITFEINGRLPVRTCSWANASLERTNMPNVVTIECMYSIKVGKLPDALCSVLIPISSRVESFQVRSS